MQMEDIRGAMQASPFVPFQLKMADGSVYSVVHPDFIAVPPKGRRITVYPPGESQSVWLDLYLIEAIEFPESASTNGSN